MQICGLQGALDYNIAPEFFPLCLLKVTMEELFGPIFGCGYFYQKKLPIEDESSIPSVGRHCIMLETSFDLWD